MDNTIEINKIWFDAEHIFIETQKGEIKNHPLAWFPRLSTASISDLNNFEISPFGIHWPALDEDLSFEGFFTFTKELQVV